MRSVVSLVKKTKKIGIVGFGLAGAALAANLLEKNVEFKVFSSRSKSASSRVAAGMFNPMVFRRLLKTWMADDILPFAQDFYTRFEQLLNDKFYFPKQYFKIFGEDEVEFWINRAQSEETKPYLSVSTLKSLNHANIKTPYGVGEVFGAGYLDVNVYLDRFETYLEKLTCFENKVIDYNQIILNKNQVEYENEVFDYLIFCEGSHGVNNPYFSAIPYRLTKGEVITIKADLSIDYALNKNGFVLPIGNNLYRVGATYEWKQLDEVVTSEGKQALVEKLENIVDADFEIVAHKAGIRPTLANRRPVYEQHKVHSQLAIFNGLGTKGVMLAPFFAKKLVEELLNSLE